MIGPQAFDEQRAILRVEHRGELGVQPGRDRPHRADPSGALLHQVTDGLAKVIAVSACCLCGDSAIEKPTSWSDPPRLEQ